MILDLAEEEPAASDPKGDVRKVLSLSLAAMCRLSYIFQAGCGWKVTVVCWPKGDCVEKSTEEENWCK